MGTVIVVGTALAIGILAGSSGKDNSPTHMGRDGAYDVYCQKAGDDVDCWREKATQADKDFRGLEKR